MEVLICKDYEEISQRAASIVIKEMIIKPNLNLGLATGSSPVLLYKKLIEAVNNKLISFKDVKTFNLDEYIGLEQSHPESYYSFMFKHLFNHVDINTRNVHLPKNDQQILNQIKDDYNLILDENPIDLQVLGIGSNGHIGFNEPGTPLHNKTFIVDLDEETRESNARFFESYNDVPKKAITMGIKNIMKSKKIILIASGVGKASAVMKALNGDVSSSVPASILQLHPNCTFIIDQDAAQYL